MNSYLRGLKMSLRREINQLNSILFSDARERYADKFFKKSFYELSKDDQMDINDIINDNNERE